MSAERWLPIDIAPGYEVSDQGRVRSLKRETPHILRLRIGVEGRPRVSIADRTFRIHTLVARAFLGPRPADLEVRHLDGDKENNRLENLVYGTHSENQLDQVRHGTHDNARKTQCPKNHPYDDANTLASGGRRWCRTCCREKKRRHRAGVRALADATP